LTRWRITLEVEEPTIDLAYLRLHALIDPHGEGTPVNVTTIKVEAIQ